MAQALMCDLDHKRGTRATVRLKIESTRAGRPGHSMIRVVAACATRGSSVNSASSSSDPDPNRRRRCRGRGGTPVRVEISIEDGEAWTLGARSEDRLLEAGRDIVGGPIPNLGPSCGAQVPRRSGDVHASSHPSRINECCGSAQTLDIARGCPYAFAVGV
jgi:hypothetical protein